MTVAENIKRIRKEKHLTQKQLGEKCGMSESTLRQYEIGYRNPKIETIKKIADALEVGLWEIVELDQMDLDTRIQEIKKMVALLTPEGLEEFERLTIESINENQESIQKEQEEAAKKAPRAYIIENGKRVEVDKPIKFTSPSRSHAQTEAYELFHSLLSEEWIMSQEQETTAVQLKKILGAYDRLNIAGRKEAVKRVDELTELPRYTRPDEPPQS
jgi:transcriptional regulator with XRE-family HTH domain|nr:helix-turn-helix transcriptional regulator [uncultured Acetatifactor sp.]